MDWFKVKDITRKLYNSGLCIRFLLKNVSFVKIKIVHSGSYTKPKINYGKIILPCKVFKIGQIPLAWVKKLNEHNLKKIGI